jgi:hypothetical protein
VLLSGTSQNSRHACTCLCSSLSNTKSVKANNLSKLWEVPAVLRITGISPGEHASWKGNDPTGSKNQEFYEIHKLFNSKTVPSKTRDQSKGVYLRTSEVTCACDREGE